MSFSIGQTFQLMAALSNAGFSERDIINLGKSKTLLRRYRSMHTLLNVLHGYAEIVPGEPVLEYDNRHWYSFGKDAGKGQAYVPLVAYRLIKVLERAGFTRDDVTRLGQFDNLTGVKDILEGRAKIVLRQHIVDLDKEPLVNELRLVRHTQGGQLAFEQSRLRCHLVKGQDRSGGILASTVKNRLETEGVTTLNANLLLFYLQYPKLIPQAWLADGPKVVFWGDTYQNANGEFVLYLKRLGGNQWSWGKLYLHNKIDQRYPALILI